MTDDTLLDFVTVKAVYGRHGIWDKTSCISSAVARVILKLEAERDELLAWQEKVCAIIQPAENADEWGADVADIIAMRERKRKALLKRAKR